MHFKTKGGCREWQKYHSSPKLNIDEKNFIIQSDWCYYNMAQTIAIIFFNLSSEIVTDHMINA